MIKLERACNREVQTLKKGMDFRLPEYRREVFHRFYEFHLKYNSHPGAVYFAFPWLNHYYNLDTEGKYWLAFINGCSQNIVTTSIIFEEFPDINTLDISKLEAWWAKVHHKFKAGSGWDSDRKHFKVGKTGFPACVKVYQNFVRSTGSQKELFEEFVYKDPIERFNNFDRVWDFVRNSFLSFGRLSTFSYLEYLRLQGLNIDCNNLFLEDLSGSKSHRNGICKVLGRDDLDWHDSNPDFPGYDAKTIQWLTEEGHLLLEESKARFYHPHQSLFTLESTLCCYKSWHRPNRRYPNVYMDMFHDRIKYAEKEWGENFKHFWKMREDNLPDYLRQEMVMGDPGLSKIKQNYYRNTGQVILMDRMWPCFENNFYRDVNQVCLERFYND